MIVGNLVAGKRIAQASGRELSHLEDSEQARKVRGLGGRVKRSLGSQQPDPPNPGVGWGEEVPGKPPGPTLPNSRVGGTKRRLGSHQA